MAEKLAVSVDNLEDDTMYSDQKAMMTGSALDKVLEGIVDDVMEGVWKEMGENGSAQKPVEEVTYVLSDEEIKKFMKDYKGLVYDACTQAGMPAPFNKEWGDLDREEVFQNVILKKATGKWYYDSARGTKESSYVYKVAYREALTHLYRRGHLKGETVLTDEEWQTIAAKTPRKYNSTADARLVFREGLNRLAQEKKCGRDQLEVLVRYMLVDSDDKAYRAKLAQEYGYRNADSVSVIANRWFPRLMSHARNVVLEDLDGRLVISTDYHKISFLKPYLEWL